MGTLPPTYYLLVAPSGFVRGEFPNLLALGTHLGVSISDTGRITFMGHEQEPRYILDPNEGPVLNNHFTKEQAVADWCRYHMRLPRGYKIYRVLA